MMLILSRVCAEFRNRLGETVLSVTPRDLLTFIEAPEEIQEDPLFTLMLRDGSLEAVRSVDQRRMLESDPDSGTSPEGRKQKTPAPAETPTSISTAPTLPGDAISADTPALSEAPTSGPAAPTLPAGPASAEATVPDEIPASAESPDFGRAGSPVPRRTRKAEK